MQTYKPGSVSPRQGVVTLIIYLAPALLLGSINLPISSPRHDNRDGIMDELPISARRKRNLFGLSTHKVYPAPDVTTRAVSSYLTISPLPSEASAKEGSIFSVALSVHKVE